MGSDAPVQAPPMRPLGDRVVVTALTATERMSGGVIIPDTAQEKPQQGIIVAKGPLVGHARQEPGGEWLPGNNIDVGDRVMYGKYAGSEITIDDVPYLVLREPDVMGVLPPLPDYEIVQAAEDVEL